MTTDRPISFRGSVVTFVLVVALTGAGAVGILVLLDPRAQTFWGVQFDGFGTSVRAFVDSLGPFFQSLPLPGR